MDALFDISMAGLLAILAGGAVAMVRRTRQRLAAWDSGFTARARVVRAWATSQVVNNAARRVQWHEYDFTTHDGRAVRFKESGGPADRAVGEEVLVHYTPQRPDRATAAEPRPGRDLAVTVVWLAVLAGCAIFTVQQWITLSRY
ncbi:DUF3592 domain-containing protein [Streptomyces sp. NPDC013455]|uniref:DUF3592 domain-containing protein n=1 Tax=Streptomyces sp. NPDC013455 TaxID=3155605 RepID=UPI00340217A1